MNRPRGVIGILKLPVCILASARANCKERAVVNGQAICLEERRAGCPYYEEHEFHWKKPIKKGVN